jgi:hypothetical protein
MHHKVREPTQGYEILWPQVDIDGFETSQNPDDQVQAEQAVEWSRKFKIERKYTGSQWSQHKDVFLITNTKWVR